MFDNELLKYYKQGHSTSGYIDAKELGIFLNLARTPRKLTPVKVDGRNYFIKKTCNDPATAKCRQDAEILLSQIYCKLGIESAIYLPAQNSYGNFLICDDVKSPKTELAGTHLYSYLAGTGLYSLPLFGNDENKKQQNLRTKLISQVYTPQAIYEQTKMRVADIASFNQDRHYQNFFYTLQRPVIQPEPVDNETATSVDIMQYFRNLLPNKATGVVAIDFEDSGTTLQEITKGNPYADFLNIYENDFDESAMPRENVIEQFKTNEAFAQTIDKQELAEEIGSVDPASVASDIKETTDYVIDPKMVDVLSRSFNEVAEALTE